MIDKDKLERVRPLLDFIARYESRGNYGVVWGRIKAKDRPKDITRMTIGQVLAWQDSIDPFYMSEAAGRYQILEDTLRGLYRSAGLTLDHIFGEDTQDRLAYALLRRRGLDAYLAGEISAEKFANSLAREWASLPVVTPVRSPNGRVLQIGESFYAGDGLNKAHAPVDGFLSAVRAVKEERAAKAVKEPWWFGLMDLLAKLFGKAG